MDEAMLLCRVQRTVPGNSLKVDTTAQRREFGWNDTRYLY